MKALTVYQPWASLESLGIKGTETRGWPTSYRGPLAIHAGVRWDHYLQERHRDLNRVLMMRGSVALPDDPPRGAILAVCDLIDCLQVTEENQTMFSDFDHIAGDLSLGRYVWVLDRVKPLREPVRCRGAQGLWTPGDELLSQIRRAS